mmetsp:Transcript_5259/g.7717  ORF Transcript_5259/g.7717 Transcript_5259/m.7717 type:complete len:271 (-) Transcript_5259:1105-1917(-)
MKFQVFPISFLFASISLLFNCIEIELGSSTLHSRVHKIFSSRKGIKTFVSTLLVVSSIGVGLNDHLSPALSNAADVKSFIADGMQSFRDGDPFKSVKQFDSAIESNPAIYPYLWQRGLSLYYSGNYKACEQQFKVDLRVNPHDMEEILWKSLCSKRTLPPNSIDQQLQSTNLISDDNGIFLSDRRPVMNKIYSVYKGTTLPETFLSEIGKDAKDDEYFYSRLYMGLYYEAIGDVVKSLHCMEDAVKSPYGTASNDYMVSLAKLHLKLRKE